MPETRSRLAALHPRPPTPPKDTTVATKPAVEVDDVQLPVLSQEVALPSQLSPNYTPTSSQNIQKASGKSSKKVGFLMGPGGATPVATSSPEALGVCSTNVPTSTSKLPKGILKTSNPTSDSPAQASPSNDPQDFPRLLEEMTRSLASSSLSSRLDAYSTLNMCLKTYKNAPALHALQEKMPLLADFIQRDVTLEKSENNVRNTQIATEVIRLITTLLWSPTMGDTIPVTLQTFMVDQAISITGSTDSPKALVNQYLHMLTIQKFRTSVLTNERANKLISNLITINERTPGKQVVAHRLLVFRRLIVQVRAIMLARVGEWIEHVFHGMMSDTQEIRTRAISLALDVGAAYGAEINVSKAVKELFRRQSRTDGSEMRYGDLFLSRLTDWLDSKEDARLVPQIWGAVVLHFRHTAGQFERWTYMVPFLKLIQRCFNSGDADVKIQANRAWMRLVYVINPDQKTGTKMTTLLRDPIKAQLERSKTLDRESRRVRASTHSLYFTLLYYAFRPGLDDTTISRHWETYVEETVLSSNTLNLDSTMICNVLASLLGSSTRQAWTTERILAHEQIKLEEIPRLDPRWVRKNSHCVLRVIEKLFTVESWWTSENGQSLSTRVWQAFCNTLKEAGAKEIKVSMDAMNSIANSVSMLSRYYIGSIKPTTTSDCSLQQRAERSIKLLRIAVSSLGHLAFTEKRLLKSSSCSYQAAETPSSRSTTKSQGELASAVGHLLYMLISATPDDCVGNEFESYASEILDVSLKSAYTRRNKLQVLRDMLPLVNGEILNDTDSMIPSRSAQSILWSLIARSALGSISIQSTDQASSDSSQHIGHDFREATKILQTMACAEDANKQQSWNRVLSRLNYQIGKEAGPAGATLVLVEPLAGAILDKIRLAWSPTSVVYSASLISNASWAGTQTEIDRSHRLLWGTSINHGSKIHNGPFDKLLSLMNEMSSQIFQKQQDFRQSSLEQFLNSSANFLDSAPTTAYLTLLKSLQSFLSAILHDSCAIFSVETDPSKAAFKAALSLWTSILHRLESLKLPEQTIIDDLGNVLLAGLGSKHRAFANITITYWNNSLGLKLHLKCSDDLKSTLYQLSHGVEILLQGVVLTTEDSQYLPIAYYETPADFESQDTQKVTRLKAPIRGLRERTPNSKDDPLVTEVRETPQRPQKHSSKTTPKLRHDDSQIQFAAIDSSPSKLESQLLTEHQREVKERQLAEANAMFADIRSSPKAKSSEKKAPHARLQLPSDRLIEHSDVEDNNSPTLPSQNGGTFLGSSPTPQERRSMSRDRSSNRSLSSSTKSQRQLPDLSQIPSSPPSVPSKGRKSSRLAKSGSIEALDTTKGVASSLEADNLAFADVSTNLVEDIVMLDKDHNVSEVEPEQNSTNESIINTEHDLLQAQIRNDMERACSQSQEVSPSKELSTEPSVGPSTRGKKRAASTTTARHPPTKKGKRSQRKAKAQQQELESDPFSSTDMQEASSEAQVEDVLDCIVVSKPESKLVSTGRGAKRRRSAMTEDTETSKSEELPESKRTRSLRKSKSDTSLLKKLVDSAQFSTPTPEDHNKSSSRIDNLGINEVDDAKHGNETTEGEVMSSQADPEALLQAASHATKTSESENPTASNVSGTDILAQVRALLNSVKTARLGSACDEIMSTIMEVGREVLDAKKREG